MYWTQQDISQPRQSVTLSARGRHRHHHRQTETGCATIQSVNAYCLLKAPSRSFRTVSCPALRNTSATARITDASSLLTAPFRTSPRAIGTVCDRRHPLPRAGTGCATRHPSVYSLMTALGRRGRPAMQTAGYHRLLLLLRRLDLRTGSATIRKGSACCLPRATFRPRETVIRYARHRHRQGARTGCAT